MSNFRPSSVSHNPGCSCLGCTTVPYGEVDGYGWSFQYPFTVLVASNTAEKKGIPNWPLSPFTWLSLSRVSDLLGRLPFPVRVTSGFRGTLLNAAVGGVKGSAHTEGRAADFNPEGLTNRQAAAFLWANREKIPNLDQVIWYQDTGHVHVAVGGKAQGQFLMGTKEGGHYTSWTPTSSDLASVDHLKLKPIWPQRVGTLALGGAIVLGLFAWAQRY